jgi:hypothetical protein
MKTLRNFGYFNILVSLPLGYFLFTNWYFWLLPAGVVFWLVALIFRDRQLVSSRWQTAIGLLPLVVTTAAIVSATARANQPFRQTILVPAGYRGLVVIGYGIADGQPEAWEDGNRLIRVSSQGTADTQFQPVEGQRSPEYDKVYSVTATGQRFPLRELLSQSAPAAGEVGVYHAYLESTPDMLVCVVARTDSVSTFLEPESYTLRPLYVRQAKSMAEKLRRFK